MTHSVTATEPADHSTAVESLLRPENVGLPAYDPGADVEEVSRRFGLARVVKLSNNESPYGVSPSAAQAIRSRLSEGVERYPEPTGRRLSRVLADRLDVSARRVVLGNGSENILELLCQAFLSAGDVVVTQAPGFGLHEIFPRMMGARVRKVPVTDGFGFDARGWLRTLDASTKAVFMANPANPTGTVFDTAQLRTIVDNTPDTALLVIDEAYYEYALSDPSYPDGLDLLRGLDRPWVVLRTFSKAYGLAGLRVGYGIASHANLADALHRVRTPYNVNQLAQDAAVAAWDDRAHLAECVRLTSVERDRLTQVLRLAGLRVAPSSANFLFIDTGRNAADVARELLHSGIIVKAWREPGYERFIRASLATSGDNNEFARHLIRICTGRPPLSDTFQGGIR